MAEPGHRDADLDALSLRNAQTGVGKGPMVDEAIRLAKEARDERDSLVIQRAPGYRFNAQALGELTPDQLRIHVLMAETEVLRLRPFETEDAALAKIRADVAEAHLAALRAEVQRAVDGEIQIDPPEPIASVRRLRWRAEDAESENTALRARVAALEGDS